MREFVYSRFDAVASDVQERAPLTIKALADEIAALVAEIEALQVRMTRAGEDRG